MTHGLYKPHRPLGQMGHHGYPKPPRGGWTAVLAIVVIVALMAWAWWSDPALPQPQSIPRCSSYAEMLQTLEQGYQEEVVDRGTLKGGGTMETLASPSGSWTKIVIFNDDMACITESGIEWERVAVQPPGKDV